MRHHRLSSEKVRGLCAEVSEDDGVDPHHSSRRGVFHGRARRAGGPGLQVRPVDRKACQLCRQVAVTLDEVLAECGDIVLQGLHVVSVAPFPDASRLLVTVTPVDGQPAGATQPETVLGHLHRASGHLRCEIASAVTRRRAPLLIYRLAEPAAIGVDS